MLENQIQFVTTRCLLRFTGLIRLLFMNRIMINDLWICKLSADTLLAFYFFYDCMLNIWSYLHWFMNVYAWIWGQCRKIFRSSVRQYIFAWSDSIVNTWFTVRWLKEIQWALFIEKAWRSKHIHNLSFSCWLFQEVKNIVIVLCSIFRQGLRVQTYPRAANFI